MCRVHASRQPQKMVRPGWFQEYEPAATALDARYKNLRLDFVADLDRPQDAKDMPRGEEPGHMVRDLRLVSSLVPFAN